MTEDRFKNRRKAWQWLDAEGFTVSEKKFYNDCDAGLVAVFPDKTVSKFSVGEYGRKLKAAPVAVSSTIDYTAKKERLELEKLELDIEKRKLDNRKEDDKWLHKEEAWAQMAAIVGTLRDALRHQCHVAQGAVILLAGGDGSRGPEVYEGLEEIIARAFNEVIQAGRIEGIFQQEDAA